MPEGKSRRTSRSRPQARAAGPTRPIASPVSRLRSPRILEPGHDGRGLPEQVDGAGRILDDALQALRKRRRQLLIQVERDSAGPDQAPAEPIAAQKRRQVQHVPANPAAIGSGGQKSDIAGQRSQISDVVGNALQLQRYAADRLGAGRDAHPGEGFNGLAIGSRVADRRVARQRFHVMDRPRRRPSGQRSLYAAMLISERDLQVIDILPVALEPEVPGFDDARMHGAHRDLMDFFSLDAEKLRIPDDDLSVPMPRIPGRREAAAGSESASARDGRRAARPTARRSPARTSAPARHSGVMRGIGVRIPPSREPRASRRRHAPGPRSGARPLPPAVQRARTGGPLPPRPRLRTSGTRIGKAPGPHRAAPARHCAAEARAIGLMRRLRRSRPLSR